MKQIDPRAELERLIKANGDDMLALSKMLGRNAAYVQQFIKRGSPKRLPEHERRLLARYFGVDEVLLGAPEPAGRAGLRMVPKLAIGASAGAGALADDDALAGKIGFDEKWLRKMGLDPARLSLIRVEGDSMQPTLSDGDDIMVDTAAAERAPKKKGIYVLRFDGTLMVKRLQPEKGGAVSILSDNPAYAPIEHVGPASVSLIGRVVWIGRRL